MAEKLESTKYFILSLGDIEILIDYAEKARDNQDDDHRKLFMKLSIVSIVTKFQVFIESLLQEILHKLRTERIKYSSIPMQLVLNSLKISSEDSLCKKIEKQSSFKPPERRCLWFAMFAVKKLKRLFVSYSRLKTPDINKGSVMYAKNATNR
jgi:hypothetical protein